MVIVRAVSVLVMAILGDGGVCWAMVDRGGEKRVVRRSAAAVRRSLGMGVDGVRMGSSLRLVFRR